MEVFNGQRIVHLLMRNALNGQDFKQSFMLTLEIFRAFRGLMAMTHHFVSKILAILIMNNTNQASGLLMHYSMCSDHPMLSIFNPP